MTSSEIPQPDDLDAIVPESALLDAERPVNEADLPCPSQPLASDRPAAEQLVDRHYEAVYRYAYRLAGCMATAEDIAQETFVQAIRYLHQLRCPEAERGWLLAIARRQFMRGLRKVIHHKHGRTTSLDRPSASLQSTLVPSALHAEERPEQASLEQRDSVEHALNQLGHDARLIVVMYYFEELSYAEIAAQLNIPLGTVMSRLSRSRDQLRKLLDEDPRPSQSAIASPLTSSALPCNVAQEARHG